MSERTKDRAPTRGLYEGSKRDRDIAAGKAARDLGNTIEKASESSDGVSSRGGKTTPSSHYRYLSGTPSSGFKP